MNVRRQSPAIYGMDDPEVYPRPSQEDETGIVKRQDETKKLLFVMAGMTVLFVAAVPYFSGISLFLAVQVVAIILGGITLVSLFWRYSGLDIFSAASIFFLYILMVALFSPGVVDALASYLIR
ncbi:MAG TPA: hypothetical protein VFG28_00460 [Syntrophales bacterium]|nr:hypothetical protein [Syntrophales bacterium]